MCNNNVLCVCINRKYVYFFKKNAQNTTTGFFELYILPKYTFFVDLIMRTIKHRVDRAQYRVGAARVAAPTSNTLDYQTALVDRVEISFK